MLGLRLRLRPHLRTPVSARSQSRATRARRSVVVMLLVVAVSVVSLDFALETVRPEWRDPEFGWRLKAVNNLERDGYRFTLALGSSRTQMGFSPKEFGPACGVVYNFGQAGCGPVQLNLNYRRLRDAGIRPDTLLIEVMPTALYQDGAAEAFFAGKTSRLSLADVTRLSVYCDDPNSLRREVLSHRVWPWHSYRFLLMSHWQAGMLPWQDRVDFQWRMMDRLGWIPYPFDTITDAKRAEGLAHSASQYVGNLANFQISPLPDRALRDMISHAQHDGIVVGIYLMPESPAFRAWYTPAAQTRIREYLERLKSEFGVVVFDCRDWLPEEQFSDGHHLLKSGARAFSTRFGAECLEPWK